MDKRWAILHEQALRSRTKKPQGDGWLTSHDLMKMFSCSAYGVKRRMRDIKKYGGGVEMFSGTQIVGGKIQATNWYRPTKGKK